MRITFRRGLPPVRSLAWLVTSTTMATLLWTSSVDAHDAPHSVWLTPETLSWVQPDGLDDWDVRVQSLDQREWERPAQPEALPVCWQEDFTDELRSLPGEAAIVWLRSRGDGRNSDWRGPQLVSVPEPTVGLGILTGGAALLGVADAVRRRARTRLTPSAGPSRPSSRGGRSGLRRASCSPTRCRTTR